MDAIADQPGEDPHTETSLLGSRSPRARRKAVAVGAYYRSGDTSYTRRFADDLTALRHDLPHILWRAWMDTKARYKRSFLGPYWLTLGTLTFVVGYSVLAKFLFGRPLAEFLGYIACGIVTWQYISSTLAEGTKVFVANANEIKSVRTNLLALPVKQALKGLIGFAHSLPIVLPVVFFTDDVNLNTLLIFPALLIVTLTLIPLATGLSTLSSRFRDIEQFTAMILQFFFYWTPLIWKKEMLGDGVGQYVALLNPLYYPLELVRAPFMGQVAPANIWIGSLVLLLLSNIIGYGVYIRLRQRIPFWI